MVAPFRVLWNAPLARRLHGAACSLLALQLACVVASEPDPAKGQQDEAGTDDPQSCDSGTHNHVAADGQCACNAGFVWCSTDQSSLDCCPDMGVTSDSSMQDSTSSEAGGETASQSTDGPETGEATDGSETGDVDESGDESETGGDCEFYDFTLENTESYLPSVIKLYFQLRDCHGEPIAGMTEDDFVIQENGQAISETEALRRILDNPQDVDLDTLVLLDMSGSVIGDVDELVDAAKVVLERLQAQGHTISLHIFDGRPDTLTIVDFSTDPAELEAGIESLREFQQVDNSTNLNGAVVSGLGQLDRRALAAEGLGHLHQGFLVLFTDGTDRAGHVDNLSAAEATKDSSHPLFTVGLGREIDMMHLNQLAVNGEAVFPTDLDELATAFEDATDELIKHANSHYVLAYCSPRRAGEFSVGISVMDSVGRLEHDFDATGFAGLCDEDDLLKDQR